MKLPDLDLSHVDFVCCSKPQIHVMDYLKCMPDRTASPRINRVCIKCWTHWVGRPNRVRRYKPSAWDALLLADMQNDTRQSKLSLVRPTIPANLPASPRDAYLMGWRDRGIKSARKAGKAKSEAKAKAALVNASKPPAPGKKRGRPRKNVIPF